MGCSCIETTTGVVSPFWCAGNVVVHSITGITLVFTLGNETTKPFCYWYCPFVCFGCDGIFQVEYTDILESGECDGAFDITLDQFVSASGAMANCFDPNTIAVRFWRT